MNETKRKPDEDEQTKRKASEEIADILAFFDLTEVECSRLTGIPRRTLVNWMTSGSNHREPPAYLPPMLDAYLKSILGK